MKAFRFRLQAVLTLREHAEQEAQHRLAQAFAAAERAAARLRLAENAIARLDDQRLQRLQAGASASELEHLRAYAGLLLERRIVFAREHHEARHQTEIARRQLTFASQRRETLDTLRSRRRKTHEYEAARFDQKVLDDLAGRGPALAEAWLAGNQKPIL